MNEIFFNGVWRMDWGLGNPNKTAALIAILMVAIWGLAYVRRWGFWIALALFSGLGVCLVHTFSRGGVVAAICGLAPLAFFSRRPWPWPRVIGIVVSIWFIVGASVFLQAHKRYSQGVTTEDRSISNRFEVWKSVPAMMVDAPGGWGIGKSGRAYMNWYQPIEQTETYRTLVNSHLTWLVELGWAGRFLYLAGWFAVLLICFPSQQMRWLAVPFGIWVAFFVGAFFSSVAESVWLWVVPVLALVWVLAWRIWHRVWLGMKSWLLPPCASAACLLLVVAGGQGSPFQKTGHTVLVGEASPDAWIVLNEKILGKNPGRSLRAALPNLGGRSVALVENIRDLPSRRLESLILAGEIPPDERAAVTQRLGNAKSVILVNPTFFPQEIAFPDDLKLRVLIGEFSQSPAAFGWADQRSVHKLTGVGDFVSDWPELVLSPQK